jgi:acyl carrier protein
MSKKTNVDRYDDVFLSTFMVSKADLSNLKYQDVLAWDSVGHMSMVAELEDAFDIEMDIDDIIDFSGYEKGKEIVAKYGVEF